MNYSMQDIANYAESLTEIYSCNADPHTADDFLTATQALKSKGFVVLRKAISAGLLARVNKTFDDYVLTENNIKLLRMDGVRSKNEFDEHSHLVNPLSNIQRQPQFRHSKGLTEYSNALLKVLTESWHISVLQNQLKSPCLELMTWNHIHCSPGTLPHQDYLFWGKNILPGQIYGAWIALEDISPQSSPLYVVSQSHNDLTSQSFSNSDINDPAYRAQLIDYMRANTNHIISPRLQAGDCLLWDSRLIHGALRLQDKSLTRKSLTAHYMPAFLSGSMLARIRQLLRFNVVATSRMNVRFQQHITRIMKR